MLQIVNPAARSLCAAALLGAALFAPPLSAAAREQGMLLEQAAQEKASPTAQPAKRSMADRAEARIKSLHDRLKITAAQEPQWSAVAQAMRDDAQAMQKAIEQRQQARSLTAVDDLKAYQAIADAHSQGLQKLIPAFQALYDGMSDEQKKNADTIFSQSRRHGRGRGK
jgi:hypothetical protein